MPRLARVTPPMSPNLRRGASVAALLAVAAIGLRARASLPSVGSPGAAAAVRHGFLVFFGAVEGVAGLACLVLLVLIFRSRRRKSRPEDDPRFEQDLMIPWWARALAMLAAVALVTVPVALLILSARGHRRSTLPLRLSGRPAPALVSPGAHVAAESSGWWLAGLAAVAVAAIGLAWSAWLRQRRPAAETARAGPAADRLSAAASAGTIALHSHADPRAAIIACYAAMERSLSGAGSPPAAADTPAEVLDRASASGLAQSAAAGALTGLFRQARYSDHAMAEEHRTAALQALAGLRADLGEPGPWADHEPGAHPMARPGNGT